MNELEIYKSLLNFISLRDEGTFYKVTMKSIVSNDKFYSVDKNILYLQILIKLQF